MQVLNRPYVEGTFGEQFDKMMENVTKMKMQDLMQRHQAQQFNKLVPNASAEQAMAFTSMNPAMQSAFTKSGFLTNLQGNVQPQLNSDPYRALMEQNTQSTREMSPVNNFSEAIPQQVNQFNQAPMDYSKEAMINNAMSRDPFSPGQKMLQEQEHVKMGKMAQRYEQSKEYGIPVPKVKRLEATLGKAIPVEPKKMSDEASLSLAAKSPDMLQQSIMNNPWIPADKKNIWIKNQMKMQEKAQDNAYKIYQKEQAIQTKRLDKIKDEDDKYRADIFTREKLALEQKFRLMAQAKLVNTGKLSEPAIASILDTVAHGVGGIGLDLRGYESRETANYRKLHAQNTSTIPKMLGGKMTQGEFNAAMKQYPGAEQNDKAKIDQLNLVYLDQVLPVILEAETTRDILKENKGSTPERLKELVKESFESKLNKIRENYIKTGKGEFEYSPPGRIEQAWRALKGHFGFE